MKESLPKLDMHLDIESFLSHEVPVILDSLQPDAVPYWGMMDAQNMVEHLLYILENSSDRREMKLLIPEEKVSRQKDFLMCDFGFMRNFKFPLLPEKEPLPHRFDDPGAALAALKEELEYFLGYWRDGEDKVCMHPMFGPLNKKEMLVFQYKHFVHHLSQFGLLKT